ncbi:ASB18 protein, partial [Onychorhynchus coronatus]|nr:ASB18 protein [Onychorhynchus coronatus]
MGDSPGPAIGKVRISSQLDSEHPLTAHAPVTRFYTALVTGDLKSLEVLTDRYHQDVNLVFEISKNELEWQVKSQASFGLSGLWALERRWERSSPLCLAAQHGHPAALRHLLRRRARPDLAPGALGALHQACRGAHTDCVELLLEYRADPNLPSKEGLAPLHLCTTRDSLGLEALTGTGVPTLQQPQPLFAPRHSDVRGGIACLYLFLLGTAGAAAPSSPGAKQASKTHFCRVKPLAKTFLFRLCRLLVAHGAHVDARDEARRSPLHKACGAAHAGLARFLLLRGADVNAIDYDGLTPLGLALQSAASRAQRRPHLTVQLLLNHGSQRIWPPAFVKVLRSCAAVPEVIEVLFNSYSQIPVSQEWAEAVQEEIFQQHERFYTSLLRLAGAVRCLQHLCRSTIRENLGSRCHSLIPLLPVPKALREYLLLEPEGVVL